MLSAFDGLVVENPKNHSDSNAPQESRLYPYYAGYAGKFAETALNTVGAKRDSIVLDPWNGSGTTTAAAAKLGFPAIGIDLNPVMVLVAKAGLLAQSEAGSLLPLAKAIVKSASMNGPASDDPLNEWLTPSSTKFVRAIESEINRALVCEHQYAPLTSTDNLNRLSALASFFYVALFRATRHLLAEFIPSNPTWIKSPLPQNRKRPTANTFHETFIEEVEKLSARLIEHKRNDILPQVWKGNAESLPLPDGSVDLVITSPPYCTRIDYAVATSIELALLRTSAQDFSLLRRSLMGTSTVPAETIQIQPDWGRMCKEFLERVYQHPSKASQTYYFKNHLQYFDSLNRSVNQLSRVIKSGGKCILVAQDSYYKDVHNDVPGIISEMAENAGLTIAIRRDFMSGRSMAGINGKARQYLRKRSTTESVLCFTKN